MNANSAISENRSKSESQAGATAASPLKGAAIKGSVWTIAGYGGGQALRLASNLLLTRMLTPEIFGVMALVQLVMSALGMFTDLGVAASVMRAHHVDDPRYLNTAWTIQATRGIGLWLAVALLSWPAAKLFSCDELIYVLPVAGLSLVLGGFGSMSLTLANRELRLRSLTILDLGTQILAMAVTLAIAWTFRSVWSLVAGQLFSATVRLVVSHTMFGDLRHKWQYDRDYAREMIRFGRWILLSTALTFIVTQADRAVLGWLLSPAELGVYAVAFVLSQVMVEVVRALAGRVLFPVYVELLKGSNARLERQNLRMRLILLSISLPVLWGMVLFGPELIRVLYDRRYHDAGWMLQILAVGSIGSIISLTSNSILLAVGDSYRYAVVLAGRSLFIVAGMSIGGYLGDVEGLLIGFAFSSFLNYPLLVWGIRRYGTWCPWLDTAAAGLSLLVVLFRLCV